MFKTKFVAYIFVNNALTKEQLGRATSKIAYIGTVLITLVASPTSIIIYRQEDEHKMKL